MKAHSPVNISEYHIQSQILTSKQFIVNRFFIIIHLAFDILLFSGRWVSSSQSAPIINLDSSPIN